MRLLLLAIAGSLALSGCHGKTDPPGAAPTGVTSKAGDGLVVLQWDTLPDLTYWIFYEPGSTVAVATPESIAIRRAFSPRVVGNLAYGVQYAFVMNATHDDSAAGPNSLPVVATPRPAGDTDTWVAGKPLGTPPQNLRSMAFTGTRFVAVGDAATIFAGDLNYVNVDPPGVTTWMPPTTLPTFTSNLSSVLFNGGFVALATDGSVISSGDGLNWVANISVPSGGMNGMAFGFVQGVPTFVAVGNGGKIFKGDLVNPWTQVGVGVTASDLTDITLLNGAFFATGTGGTMLVSPDGNLTWTPQQTNTTSALHGMTFASIPTLGSNGIFFVAVGDGGTIVTIADPNIGTIAGNWTVTTLPVPQNLRSVTLGGAFGTRLLAVGLGGAVVHSDDGVKWDVAPSGVSNNLAKVIFTSGMYLAVGDAGANVVAQ